MRSDPVVGAYEPIWKKSVARAAAMTDTDSTSPTPGIARPGMFATVRNRRGIITAAEPFDGPSGRVHLVTVDYKDDQFPREEKLIWELEPRRTLLEPTALPDVASSDPMPAEDFDALLRAARWSAARPFLNLDGSGPADPLAITSPFHGAVQV